MTETDAPLITSDLPGIGGSIKNDPNHFRVEELPAYFPAGQGDRVYVRLKRSGWNTRDLARGLADLFSLREVDVGVAGQKDKEAVVIQTFSLLLPRTDEAEVKKTIETNLPVEVLDAARHGNKLKTGHLVGNSFTIILVGPEEGALEKAGQIRAAIMQRGLPNYYGEQRFGVDGGNADKGREVLEGRGPRQHWLRRFLLSAFQARLFNSWLAERIQRGWFNRILTGDVAKKTTTGGMFDVQDETAEKTRFENGEITYTGPIYGVKMRRASGRPGELEAEILTRFGVTDQMLKKGRLDGSRRTGRLILTGLDIEPHDQGLLFRFSLPKGSYATTLMREFIK